MAIDDYNGVYLIESGFIYSCDLKIVETVISTNIADEIELKYRSVCVGVMGQQVK